jgi:hypothetical protein
VRDGIPDRNKLREARLVRLNRRGEWLSMPEPAVSSTTYIMDMPLRVVFSIDAPFCGGIEIGRKTASHGPGSPRRLVAYKVQKECGFEEHFPSSKRLKHRQFYKTVSALLSDLCPNCAIFRN